MTRLAQLTVDNDSVWRSAPYETRGVGMEQVEPIRSSDCYPPTRAASPQLPGGQAPPFMYEDLLAHTQPLNAATGETWPKPDHAWTCRDVEPANGHQPLWHGLYTPNGRLRHRRWPPRRWTLARPQPRS